MSKQEIDSQSLSSASVKPSAGQQVLRLLLVIGVTLGLAVGVIGITYGIAFRRESQRSPWVAVEQVFTPDNPPSTENFVPTYFPTPFPAITEFSVIRAEEAKTKLDDAELVLGVVVNDEARAYPINMLTGPTREILNDTLGGRAIAATW